MSSLSPIESVLLDRITTTQDSAALTELINMHTGIYYMIASKYCRTYPDIIKLNDIDDDRMTNMYQWIIQYKPEKEMKLGSYIGERIDYLCRDILKRERHNPLSPSALATLPSGDAAYTYTLNTQHPDNASTMNDSSDLYSHGTNVVVVDTVSAAAAVETANTNIAIEDTMKAIDDPALGLDPRFKVVFGLRHLQTPSLGWRQIGKQIGLSHEMSRQVYQKGMAILSAHLGGPAVTVQPKATLE